MESGNDYLIQLKRNRRFLYKQIEKRIHKTKPFDKCSTIDKSRGRVDYRKYECYNLEDFDYKDWQYINYVIRVTRQGKRNNKAYKETSYYVSNKYNDALNYAQGIRGHWGVENGLHREKDVVYKEDTNRIRNYKMAINVSLLQTTSLNIIRLKKIKSIKRGHEKYANKVKTCMKLIYNPIHI